MTILAKHLTDLPGYWKRTYEKDLKRMTLLVILEALGLSKELMDYWTTNNKASKMEDVMDAVGTLYNAGFIAGPNAGDRWAWDDIIKDWYTNDWRGAQGSTPSSEQLVEHCMSWRAKQKALSVKWQWHGNLADDQIGKASGNVEQHG
jgi:hypothetical protein